jgi:hypothetical protein
MPGLLTRGHIGDYRGNHGPNNQVLRKKANRRSSSLQIIAGGGNLDSNLCNLGVFELGRLYRQNELSPVEVVNAHLDRCERLNPVLNSFLLILKEQAKEAARAHGFPIPSRGGPRALARNTVSIKDLIQMQGTRTTGGHEFCPGTTGSKASPLSNVC